MIKESFFEDLKIGDEGISPSVTVTDQHIRTYADLVGDHTPIHLDDEIAKKSIFGTRIAHGLFGLALADGLKTQSSLRFPPGAALGWVWDFVAPIKLGDAVHVKFTVRGMRETKKAGWGIVVLDITLVNQRGEIVQRGEHKLMIPRRCSTRFA